MLGKGSYNLTNIESFMESIFGPKKSESVGIVEDMANRAREWKAGLLVPDYIDFFDLSYEPPTAARTLPDSIAGGPLGPFFTQKELSADELARLYTSNIDKTTSEMLELDQLTPASIPDIRHRKMQLD